MRGIDVSENNGVVDWQEIKEAGIDFAIIRLGWGRWHLDENFYDNVNGALAAGLDIGVYYYSYALSEADAADEADFAARTLIDCGLTREKLKCGVWFDMEDADGYKESNDATDSPLITKMCEAFISTIREKGYDCGIYASLDWLENRIDTGYLAAALDYVKYWCAQWDRECDWPDSTVWQYTDELRIGDHYFDGNLWLE